LRTDVLLNGRQLDKGVAARTRNSLLLAVFHEVYMAIPQTELVVTCCAWTFTVVVK
jgi:hypothetical protein